MSFALKTISLLGILVLVFIAQSLFGLSFSALTDPQSTSFLLFTQYRLPSAIAATLGGGLLSVAGLQMQTFFRNPLAGPYVTGVSSGASLGIALLIVLLTVFDFQLSSSWLSFLFASGGALLACTFILFLAKRLHSKESLLLVGLMVAGAVSAIVELIQLFMSNQGLRSLYLWNQGSFFTMTFSQTIVLVVVFLFVAVLSVFISGSLDLLMLGDDIAKLSGLKVNRTRNLALLSAAVSSGVVTAFCGPIGFVGMAVPHIARLLFKSNFHLPLTVFSFLIGGIICGVFNLMIVSNVFGMMIPVNILTALFGSPFVIWLIYKQRGEI